MSTGAARLEPWETDDWQWFYESRPVESEADWLACPNPGALLDYVNGTRRVGRRKFFLAGAACVRRVWHLVAAPEARAAVEAAERYADGQLNAEELGAFGERAEAAFRRWPEDDARFLAGLAAARLRHDLRGNHGNAELTMYVVGDVPRAVASASGAADGSAEWTAAQQREMRALADVYRCVMGNPFRPITLNPGWRTADVVGLARGIYEDLAFDRLPVLADALMEAGCEDEQILGHCQFDGPHVRGCWVLDLVLGTE